MPAKEKTTKRSTKSRLSSNEQKAIRALSAIAVRASIAARLGKSFSDDRDVYEALGYPKQPTWKDYMARYKRQDVARAVIKLPVDASWRKIPIITESEDDETEFEKRWNDIVDARRIFHYLGRVDRLARVGTYSILLLGTDDSAGFEEELTGARELLYMTPYSQENATIASYVEDTKNPRYGLPETYSITMKRAGIAQSSTRSVHWSRVIHVAEECLEDDVEGTPQLQAILNRLHDIERVSGGSAEMFWRGGFPGLALKKDPEATIGSQSLDDLEDEMEEYLHGLKRYLRLQGMDIQSLAPQVADPSNHVGMLLDLISVATRIPKRILMGSERGELASSMDEQNWLDVVDARRRDHCEPVVLRPFIDRLIRVGILPEPRDGYTVNWPNLVAKGEKEQAEIGEIRSKTLKNYVDSMGGTDVVPPDVFLRSMMGYTDDEIDQIEAIIEDMRKNETVDGDVDDVVDGARSLADAAVE